MDFRWSTFAYRLYFGKNGIAPFRKHSPQYDDFVVFFTRFQRAAGVSDSESDYRKALDLFLQYQTRKQEQTKIKIQQSRESLPIRQYQVQIVEAIKEHRVVIVAADTGAGKSTQVPQYLMEAGFQRIACTQPRRIACFSLAKRVGYESMYGDHVGYQVRFDNSTSKSTRLVFLTEGVLLRQFAMDPLLKMYDVIIVDEVHERHHTGDFLLGVLKKVLQDRLDLRVVLMSATINIDLFQRYFDAPVIQVPGRMFPVKMIYLPVEDEDTNLTLVAKEHKELTYKQSIPCRATKLNPLPYLRILERIDEEISIAERGDLLIFVSGINEIAIVSEELRKYASATRRWIVLELHSTLAISDQEKVFDVAPEGIRKCIVSTNIAETSVTIDGIRFIVDSGKAKEMAFETTTGTSRLSEYWISKSSAKQRTGRAGRTGPGVCYRFYSEKEYDSFLDYPVPEILRMSIDSICLEIKAQGLGDPRLFDFLEKPPEMAIERAIQELISLGCLDHTEEITDLGKVLVSLPIDLTLGKMLVLGAITSFVDTITVIVSLLSIQSPFTRVADSESKIIEQRKHLHSLHGDIFTLINVYSSWLEVKTNTNNSRGWTKARGIEEQRMYEVSKLQNQFSGIISRFASDPLEILTIDEDLDKEEKKKFKDLKRQLAKRKRETKSNSRKLLRLDEDEPHYEIEEHEETIEELEFLLKNNPKNLLQKSDVSNLSERDVVILKLILCSGLYPNIAISDEFNYSRAGADQVYHTKSKKFVSMLPSSVFTYRPELLQSHEQVYGESSLHPKRVQTEIICFMQILETHKPFILNPLRIPALPVCLLFAQKLEISSDDWLHIEFFDSDASKVALSIAVRLRYRWLRVVDKQLKEWNQRECNAQIWTPNGLEELQYIPKVVREMRSSWIEAFGEDCEINQLDVLDNLVEFVDIDVKYSCEKLKSSKMNTYFGYDPSQEGKRYEVFITPHFRYYLQQDHYNDLDHTRYRLPIKLKDYIPQTKSGRKVEIIDTGERNSFFCPSCSKTILLTATEQQRHINRCSLQSQ